MLQPHDISVLEFPPDENDCEKICLKNVKCCPSQIWDSTRKTFLCMDFAETCKYLNKALVTLDGIGV